MEQKAVIRTRALTAKANPYSAPEDPSWNAPWRNVSPEDHARISAKWQGAPEWPRRPLGDRAETIAAAVRKIAAILGDATFPVLLGCDKLQSLVAQLKTLDFDQVFLGYDENMTLREANAPKLPRVHELLEEGSLKTLPLWLLGSSVGLQRAAENAASTGRESSEIDYHRGVGELVAGRWSDAALLFESASTGDWTHRLLPFHAYARCRAGDYEVGRSLVKDFHRTKGGRHQGAILRFLRRICSSS